MLLLAALLFLSAVNAGCSGAEIIRGKVHAYCTDEITGVDFEFVDIDGTFLRAMSALSVKSTAASMRLFNDNVNIYKLICSTVGVCGFLRSETEICVEQKIELTSKSKLDVALYHHFARDLLFPTYASAPRLASTMPASRSLSLSDPMAGSRDHP